MGVPNIVDIIVPPLITKKKWSCFYLCLEIYFANESYL